MPVMKRPASLSPGWPLKKPAVAWNDDDSSEHEANDEVEQETDSSKDPTGCTRQQMHCWRKFKADLPPDIVKKYDEIKNGGLPGHTTSNNKC